MTDLTDWDDEDDQADGLEDDDETPESGTVRRMKQERGGAYTEEVREEALRLYEEIGPTEASKRLAPGGPSKATITTWAKQDGVVCRRNPITEAATEAMQTTWKHRRAGLANDYGTASAEALEASREAIAAGRANDARGYMITAAVATDKADVLSGFTAQPSAAFPVDMAEALAQLERAINHRESIEVASSEVVVREIGA